MSFIDGKVPDEARSLKMTKVWLIGIREFGVFATDITGNDIRTTKVESPSGAPILPPTRPIHS